MTRVILFLLAVCTLACSTVLRDTRAVNTDEQEVRMTPQTTQRVLCAPQTPCGWNVYKAGTKLMDINITNTYCDCPAGTVCQWTPSDTSANPVVVLRCRPPTDSEEHEEHTYDS